VFSTHIAILAQSERIAQVLHSFDSVKPRLSVGVSLAFDTTQDRQPCPFRESFGESVGLVEPALSQSGRVKWHGDQVMQWTRLYPGILGRFNEILHEHPAQIILAAVLEAMDQISQYTLCLIIGHHAVKSRPAIFAVWAREFSRNEPIERSGATTAKRRLNARRCRLAIVAEKGSKVLRMSAPDTVGRIEQLN
jgi:hypothetical protein